MVAPASGACSTEAIEIPDERTAKARAIRRAWVFWAPDGQTRRLAHLCPVLAARTAPRGRGAPCAANVFALEVRDADAGAVSNRPAGLFKPRAPKKYRSDRIKRAYCSLLARKSDRSPELLSELRETIGLCGVTPGICSAAGSDLSGEHT